MSEWLVCLTARADLHIIRAVLGIAAAVTCPSHAREVAK